MSTPWASAVRARAERLRGAARGAGDGQIDDVLHGVGVFTTRSCESGGRGFQAVAPMRP